METVKSRFGHLFNTLVYAFVCCFLLIACKGKNNDADIQNAINSKIAAETKLAGVSATVMDGVVTIMGNCEDENCRREAENEIKEVDGVDKVVNNITVSKVTVMADDDLQKSTQEVIKKYKNVQATVNEGIVTLRGKAEKEELQQLMMDLNALHPKRIENQLVIE